MYGTIAVSGRPSGSEVASSGFYAIDICRSDYYRPVRVAAESAFSIGSNEYPTVSVSSIAQIFRTKPAISSIDASRRNKSMQPFLSPMQLCAFETTKAW